MVNDARRSIWSQTVLFIAILIGSCAIAHAESDPQRVARQLREYAMGENTQRGERLLDDAVVPKTGVSAAMKLAGQLEADGSWVDIDYSNGDRAAWPAFSQLSRVLSIVVQARRADTLPVDSAKCISAAHLALGYWIDHDFQCPNWWFNQIGVPKALGNIGLLMDSDLTPKERDYIVNVAMARSKVGTMTGQNRTWLAGNGVMRAALMNDDTLLGQAAGVIRDEIRFGDVEGLQPDWSFHQHGPQQQFGNYGLAYAVEMARWAMVLRGTKYAIEGDKLEVLRNYLFQGQGWISWRGAMDISSCGRQLEPGSPRGKAGAVAGVMRMMSDVDPEHAGEYLGFIARNQEDAINDLVGNRCFWRSDYIVHRRPGWMITLKMSSSRVIGGETVNSENLSGAHLADGATFFYRTGHEYDDIFPAWDWRKIPGTTCVQDDGPLVWPKRTGPIPGTAFVGGVSDGMNSCAAMDIERDNLQAKKAWFFCGDLVICLGAEIHSTAEQPVLTTINQCLLSANEKTSTPAKLGDRGWIEQGGLRYGFPSGGTDSVHADSGPRTGNWRSVFTTASTPKADVSREVFTLWIDHGSAPDGASYAYYVEPAGASDPNLKVVANTVEVQAVSVGDDWVAAIFWKPGSVILGGQNVQIDQPCVLAATLSYGKLRLAVADPTETLKTINIVIGEHHVDLGLPQGGDAGRSVVKVIH
jgi:chondroitin AC lyase